MQARSEAWKALWASGAARLESKAVIGGVEFPEISPPTVNRALMQDGPSIGNVVSATCRFSLRRDPDAGETCSGETVTFDGTASAVERLAVNLEPAQSGSGTPSPENVRPISGWTGATVTRTGKNLFSSLERGYSMGNDSEGYVFVYDSGTAFFADIEPNTTYTIKDHSETTGNRFRIIAYPTRPQNPTSRVMTARQLYMNNDSPSRTYTFNSGEYRFVVLTLSNSVYYEDAKAQLELGREATAYEPYQGSDTYSISFPSEAGTVYGGTLDVTAGTLTVDRALWTSDGKTFAYNNDGSAHTHWTANVPDSLFVENSDTVVRVMSDRYAGAAGAGGVEQSAAYAVSLITRNRLYFALPKSVGSDASKAREWFDGNPTSVLYPLANPVTYTLTPAEITLLTGTNVIWADAGAVEVSIGPAPIPRSAETRVLMRLTDGETTSEWLPAGTFFISRRSKDPATGLLTLECYDALLKANALWEPTEGDWPRSAAAVANELAALLGVVPDDRNELATEGYTIGKPEAGATVREVLGGIAAYNGGSWVLTPENKLRLVPFAPGDGAEEVEVEAVIGGVDAGEAGVVTGLRCAAGDASAMIGDDSGIVLDVPIAPLWAADLAERLAGAVYRPFSLRAACYDPAAELGDAVRYGGETVGMLCAEAATLGPAFRGDLSAPDAGELADEYPYLGGGDRLLAVAKAYAKASVEALDTALTQREIFDRLTDGGAAQGLALADGQLYVNASFINTGTLSAERIDLQGYDTPFAIPDENDAASLFPGQSVEDGWITEGGSRVTVLKIDNSSREYAGKSVSLSFQAYGTVEDGEIEWTTMDEDGAVATWESVWPTPTYGSEEADGTLVGATAESDHSRYTKTFAVPEDAVSCTVRFYCGKARRITAAFDMDTEYTLRYGTNIGLSNTGLQVGKFIVDRSGNVTANRAVKLNGSVALAAPLPVASGGTGQTSLQAARNAMGLGNTAGALPIANGGTGKTTAADAWAALGGGASGKHPDSYFALAGHTHGYLPLSGGDMTGSIRQKLANVTRGTAPSANVYRTYEFIDSANKRLAQVECGALSDGSVNLQLYVLGNHADSDQYGGIVIRKVRGSTGNYNAQYDANTGSFSAQSFSGTWAGNAVAVNKGGTGATTAAGALSNLGIKYKTVTNTTTSNGHISLGLSGTRYWVISAFVDGATYCCVPYCNTSGAWIGYVLNAYGSAVIKSTSVTVKVVYIDFGSSI